MLIARAEKPELVPSHGGAIGNVGRVHEGANKESSSAVEAEVFKDFEG